MTSYHSRLGMHWNGFLHPDPTSTCHLLENQHAFVYLHNLLLELIKKNQDHYIHALGLYPQVSHLFSGSSWRKNAYSERNASNSYNFLSDRTMLFLPLPPSSPPPPPIFESFSTSCLGPWLRTNTQTCTEFITRTIPQPGILRDALFAGISLCKQFSTYLFRSAFP